MLAQFRTWCNGDISANDLYGRDLAKALRAIEARTLLMPGDRRASVIEHDLLSWPNLHVRLALLEDAVQRPLAGDFEVLPDVGSTRSAAAAGKP